MGSRYVVCCTTVPYHIPDSLVPRKRCELPPPGLRPLVSLYEPGLVGNVASVGQGDDGRGWMAGPLQTSALSECTGCRSCPMWSRVRSDTSSRSFPSVGWARERTAGFGSSLQTTRIEFAEGWQGRWPDPIRDCCACSGGTSILSRGDRQRCTRRTPPQAPERRFRSRMDCRTR